jgi:hypothetical protein
MMGATLRQPDGFLGTTAPAHGITKEQIPALLTDPMLDR